MSKRYFSKAPANKPVGKLYFDPVDTLSGILYGVYATEDEAVIASILEAMKDPRAGLKEITQDDYNLMVQKKTQSSPGSPAWKRPIQPVTPTTRTGAPLAAIKGQGAAVRAAGNPDAPEVEPPVSTEPVASVAEALKVEAAPAGPRQRKKRSTLEERLRAARPPLDR